MHGDLRMNLEQHLDKLKFEGEPVAPRLSASVLLARPAAVAGGFELLFTRRPNKDRFAGGQVVFPGGKVDPEDYHGSEPLEAEPGLPAADAAALRRAAVREVREEVGLTLSPAALLYWTNWVTPAPLPIRYDTFFFVAALPQSVEPIANPDEVSEILWLHPRDALEAFRQRRINIMFPTFKNLEQLAPLDGLDQLIAFVCAFPRVRVEPVMRPLPGGGIDLTLPDAWPAR